MKNKNVLGKVRRTARGFEYLEFDDIYDVGCSLQASSLAIYDEPGTSAVWLGVDDPDPQILVRGKGWQKVELPKGINCKTRMHLNRDQVAALIVHLQNWLKTDSFGKKKKNTCRTR